MRRFRTGWSLAAGLGTLASTSKSFKMLRFLRRVYADLTWVNAAPPPGRSYPALGEPQGIGAETFAAVEGRDGRR